MEKFEKKNIISPSGGSEIVRSPSLYKKSLRIVSSLGVCGSQFAMSLAGRVANVQ